jgi:ABC-type polysaccharide/polyol phosphate export permease
MLIKTISDTRKTMSGKPFLASNGKYYKPHRIRYIFLPLNIVAEGSIILCPAFAIIFGYHLLIFIDNIVIVLICAFITSILFTFLFAYLTSFLAAFLTPLEEIENYEEEKETTPKPKKSFFRRYMEYRAKHLNKEK